MQTKHKCIYLQLLYLHKKISCYSKNAVRTFLIYNFLIGRIYVDILTMEKIFSSFEQKKNFFNNYILCRKSLLYHQIVLNNNFNLNMGRSSLLITHDKLLSKARKYSLFVTLRGTFCSIIVIIVCFFPLGIVVCER